MVYFMNKKYVANWSAYNLHLEASHPHLWITFNGIKGASNFRVQLRFKENEIFSLSLNVNICPFSKLSIIEKTSIFFGSGFFWWLFLWFLFYLIERKSLISFLMYRQLNQLAVQKAMNVFTKTSKEVICYLQIQSFTFTGYSFQSQIKVRWTLKSFSSEKLCKAFFRMKTLQQVKLQ